MLVKMIHKQIEIPIYNDFLHIVYGTLDDLYNFIEENYPDCAEDAISAVSDAWDDHSTLAITINVRPDVIIYSDKITDFVTLVHEIFHASFDICDSLGIRTDNSESHAYLFEFLFEEIRKWYKIDIPYLVESDLLPVSKRTSKKIK